MATKCLVQVSAPMSAHLNSTGMQFPPGTFASDWTLDRGSCRQPAWVLAAHAFGLEGLMCVLCDVGHDGLGGSLYPVHLVKMIRHLTHQFLFRVRNKMSLAGVSAYVCSPYLYHAHLLCACRDLVRGSVSYPAWMSCAQDTGWVANVPAHRGPSAGGFPGHCIVRRCLCPGRKVQQTA